MRCQKLLIITTFLLLSIQCLSQYDSSYAQRSLVNKKRIQLVTAGNIVGYGGTMALLYNAWYKNYPQGRFHTFNDNREWLQVDKVGHMYSAYIESKASMEMWRWAGLPRKQRIWIGGMSGAIYQTAIEILDGFSTQWGWSWGDFAANIAGSGILVAQELAWDDQRIHFKFSFHRNDYGDPILNARADELFGAGLASRMLKDYNAQTYWLSANLKSFFPKSNLPAWLNLAVGYGANGMFGGETNQWVDKNGIAYNRNDITRYRQWYLSPDIDFTRIKTKKKWVKTGLLILNAFKMPAPALQMSRNGLQVQWLYF
ncbi:MAG: YfiM family protein [Chitinophagaceae bacterium]|nr:YfiM family protein [Chitinophagaceae bacterium]